MHANLLTNTIFTLMKVDRGHRKFSVLKPTIERMNHSSEIKSTDRHRQSVFNTIIYGAILVAMVAVNLTKIPLAVLFFSN